MAYDQAECEEAKRDSERAEAEVDALDSKLKNEQSKLNDAYAALYEAEQSRDSASRDDSDAGQDVNEQRNRLNHYQRLEHNPETERDIADQKAKVDEAERRKSGTDLALHWANNKVHTRKYELEDAKSRVQAANSEHQNAQERARHLRHRAAEKCH